jgi:hypothetical protein
MICLANHMQVQVSILKGSNPLANEQIACHRHAAQSSHTCLICHELLGNSKITGGAREERSSQ